MTGLSSIPEGYVGAHDRESGTWTDPVTPTFKRVHCVHCVHCGLRISVLRPDGNRRPSDGELRGRLLPERCAVATVQEVMAS